MHRAPVDDTEQGKNKNDGAQQACPNLGLPVGRWSAGTGSRMGMRSKSKYAQKNVVIFRSVLFDPTSRCHTSKSFGSRFSSPVVKTKQTIFCFKNKFSVLKNDVK